jgi:hypothetical protein
VTDIIIANEALVRMAVAIGVAAVALVAFIFLMVGSWMSHLSYKRHAVEWSTDEVRQRNRDLISQLAEKDRVIADLRSTLAGERDAHADTRARIKGALNMHGQVTAILTEVDA